MGIGAALLLEVLELGRAARVQRVWAVTAFENRAALRLLVSCGFRLMQSDSDATELDIDLDLRREPRELKGISRTPISLAGRRSDVPYRSQL